MIFAHGLAEALGEIDCGGVLNAPSHPTELSVDSVTCDLFGVLVGRHSESEVSDRFKIESRERGFKLESWNLVLALWVGMAMIGDALSSSWTS